MMRNAVIVGRRKTRIILVIVSASLGYILSSMSRSAASLAFTDAKSSGWTLLLVSRSLGTIQ